MRKTNVIVDAATLASMVATAAQLQAQLAALLGTAPPPAPRPADEWIARELFPLWWQRHRRASVGVSILLAESEDADLADFAASWRDLHGERAAQKLGDALRRLSLCRFEVGGHVVMREGSANGVAIWALAPSPTADPQAPAQR